MSMDVLNLNSIYSDGSEGFLRELVDTQEERRTPRRSTNTLQDDSSARHVAGDLLLDQRSDPRPQDLTIGQPKAKVSAHISTTNAIVMPTPHPHVISPQDRGMNALGGETSSEGQRQSRRQSNHTTATGPVPTLSTRNERRESMPRQSDGPNSLIGLQRALESLYSEESEGDILRAFVDAQEQPPATGVEKSSSASHRSTPLSLSDKHQQHRRTQSSHTGVNGIIAGPSKRRSRQHSQSHHENMNLDISSKELLRNLMAQKNATNTLRRALRAAIERVDTEAQRVVALERDNHQNIEQLVSLNESKVAAQREALKVATELRLYQYQYEHAQREITRAQEMVRTVENQRNEAEEEASRARAQARKHLQERVVAAAKEEGRRLGFEAGLKQAQAEAGYTNPNPQNVLGNSQPGFSLDDFNMDAISSPIRQRTPHSQRLNLPAEHLSPPFRPRVQSPTPPESEDFEEDEESFLPPQPASLAAPTPEFPRAISPSPSVQMYSISIPTASELERNNSQNTYLGNSSKPWVTAQEYHQMTAEQPNNYPVNMGIHQRNNVVTFAPGANVGKKKESWLRRTLSRPWRKKQTTSPETPTSRYQTRSGPPVHVRDFAGGSGPPRSSNDSASVSTHASQFDLQPGPSSSSSHGSSERGLRSGAPSKGRRRVRDRENVLSVIDENPLSRTATPLPKDASHRSPNMGEIRSLVSQESTYSNPKAVDDWRRSSASVPKEMAENPVGHETPTAQKPPRRRPVHLTVPSPLALSSESYADTPGPRVMSSNSQESASLGLGTNRPGLQRNVTVGSLVGITVVPPSRSPTEAPLSGRPPQGEFLSPSLTMAPSLPSAPSVSSYFPQTRHSNPVVPLAPQQGGTRPGSTASRSQRPVSQSKSPMGSTASHPLPSSDQFPFPQQVLEGHPRRSSVASRATTNVNVSARSGIPSEMSVSRNMPQQGSTILNPNTPSHRRTVSDSTFLAPNTTAQGGVIGDDGYGLHRVASNLSMSSFHSANQYLHFDPTTYVEPTTLYAPVAGPSRSDGRPRTHSNASTLSYVP